MFIKVLLGFILIATIETLNGIFRIKILHKLTKKYSKLISFLIGAILIVLLNLILLPWIYPNTITEAFLIGFIWGFLMICYDIFVGKVLFKLPWQKVLDDFNIFKGNLVSLGIWLIVFFPSIYFLLTSEV